MTLLVNTMHNFFHNLDYTVSSSLVDNLIEFINNAPPHDWKILYEFQRLTVPESILTVDPVMYNLVQHFGSLNRIGIFRYSPNYAFKWHTDPSRDASINLLLTGYDSLCLFGDGLSNGGIENVTKLSYKKCAPAILNTSKYHTIINFSEKRYLLSIGIPKPSTFEDVVSYALNITNRDI